MCTFSQSIKKRKPDASNSLRHSPQTSAAIPNILCSIDGEPPHLLMDPGLSTSPIYYIMFSLMFISSMARNHKVNGDLSADNNMAIMKLRQPLSTPPLRFLSHFTSFGVEKHVRQVHDLILIHNNIQGRIGDIL